MKAPAFQWYPKDIEADEAVVLMSNRQFGAYVHLLNHAWLNNGIPRDEVSQAKIVKEPVAQWRNLWPGIESRWVEHPTDSRRLVNPRQEIERSKQFEHKAERSEAGRRGADKRWHSHNSANGSAMQEPMAKNSSASASATAVYKPPTVPLPGDVRKDDGYGWRKAKFSEFWAVVWLKVGRDAAWQVWQRKVTSVVMADRVIEAAKQQGPRLLSDAAAGDRTPVHPRTWLHQGRYQDEMQILQPRLVGVPVVDEPARRKTAEEWHEDAKFFRGIGRDDTAAVCERHARDLSVDAGA